MNRWVAAGIVTTAVICLPILTVCVFLFAPASDNWPHLFDTVLPSYVKNSLFLMFGVALGAGSIGITTAWLTSMYQFPGRAFFTWALLLPLAMPAYIIAYTYTGMLDVSGPVQSWIRETFDLRHGDYWFPEIRSMQGAIAMFSLVLYPYVYLLVRTAFIGQSVCALEASRTLGCSAWQSFRQVALPLARPAVAAGLSLALMETLADFGTVQYFGVSTFTTGIFRTWFGMYDTVAAAQLSAFLLLFVFGLIALERWSRQRAKYHHTTNKYQHLTKISLNRRHAWIATIACALPLFCGFLLPFLQLIIWATETFGEMIDGRFLTLAMNSFTLAVAAAVITLIPALILGYGNRIHPSRVMRMTSRLAAMGYAIPGTVIAVGVLIPFGYLDRRFNHIMSELVVWQPGLIFSGTLFILLFAYTVRFLSISLQTVEAGLDKVKPSMDDAACSMGHSKFDVLKRIHFPMIKGSLFTAIVIVFVDVLKELPATLVLRPFDFNTLAVRAYELASDERLADSSSAALAIVAAGIIPVIILSSAITESRAGSR